MKLLKDPDATPGRKRVFLHLITTGKVLDGEIDRCGVFHRVGYEPMDIEEFSPCLLADHVLGPDRARELFLEDFNSQGDLS